MPLEIVVKLPDGRELAGSHPLVAIGPNGSGKTRLGVELANLNDADRIPALRNIQLNEKIGMRSVQQATKELSNEIQNKRSHYWQMSNEIDILLSKLLGQDSASATSYRDAQWAGKPTEIEQTKVMILKDFWRELFPGRALTLSYDAAKVQSNHYGSQTEYLAQHMSDGERVALYLAARVLDADKAVLVIDEPEVHFHTRLAVRFWNKLEEIRSDCRFIYITHDLSFALSRNGAQFLVVQPTKQPQCLDLDSTLPAAVSQALLGAASFSIFAQEVVFCEGIEGEYTDFSLYSAWFRDPGIAVIPVGSCDDVVQCVSVFGQSKLVSGVSAVGIIDRDYWPDSYLDKLPTNVHVLEVHERESLLCLRAVFLAVADHIGIGNYDAAARYEKALEEARRRFTGSVMGHQISERFKRRCEREILPALNGLRMSADITDLERMHVEDLANLHQQLAPARVFAEERTVVQNAIGGPENEFLKILPGKELLAGFARALGVDRKAYMRIVEESLHSAPHSEASLARLGESLETALTSYLPRRLMQDEEGAAINQ